MSRLRRLGKAADPSNAGVRATRYFFVTCKRSHRARLTRACCITNVYMKTKAPKRSGTSTLTVRVPIKLKNRLEGLAKSTSSNRSRLAVEALQSYVDEQEEQLARIDQGIRDADAGRVVPHEEVKRYLQSWGSNRKLPPPECK